ncbi:DNA polymerase III subunit delta [Vibrio sp.]|uniref:DNA polymerase III subunit delta n=1 Tax=Vibrio viridaestus TaxID=2487322 RepID=A0A3N9TE33_9VIBR|nr:DNA polymerase III subunit delta [Vibrio viridaestus]MDC0611584.1 DNA polymerase III subunit delta [Vibrio sp.]RQW62461.1 DNA polymerase III subunit delta [Vibrio viridaestus]
MRIYAEKLADTLSKQFHPLYLLVGNEPLLLEESRNLVETSAKKSGFDEIHRYTADNSLDWNDVYDQFQSMSLFSSRQVIELFVPDSGLNAQFGKQISELLALNNPDIILIIQGPRVTRAQENTQWFKSLTSSACVVNCLTPDVQRLPQFVLMRCQKLGLKPDSEALQMLAQWHEGNLLALTQSLEKLALQYSDGQLTLVRLEESLNRHNHFTAFHWIDSVLEGKANRAQRILRQLESEGVEVIILLRTVQKELLLLWQMKALQSTRSTREIFDQFKVWQNRRPYYSQALNRLSQSRLKALLHELAQIEILSKTQYSDEPWLLIKNLSVEMSTATQPR